MNISNPRVDAFKKYKSYLYDYIYENHLDWPCVTCKWGPLISSTSEYLKQKIYFACRTDGAYNESDNTWKKIPSFLVVAIVEFPNIGKTFNQELNNIFLQENIKKCPTLKVKQIIVHPGDANIMKKSYLNPKWIATKTDNKDIFIWDLDKHKFLPPIKENDTHAHIPDITLSGHTDVTSFALDWAKTSHRVASGGKDTKVLIWDLEDYQSKLSTNYILGGKRELNFLSNSEQNIRLNHRETLEGHKQSVEDLSFNPKDRDILVSVGCDKKIFGWDLRIEGHKHAFEMQNMHLDDINCVDWNLLDENYIATGSNDSSSCIIDLRMRKEIQRIRMPEEKMSIQCIKFSNFNKNIIGIASDSLHIYEINKNKPIFTHIGYRGNIVDLDWNSESDWSLISANQESDALSMVGGGTLNIFRPLDLLCMSESEAKLKIDKILQK